MSSPTTESAGYADQAPSRSRRQIQIHLPKIANYIRRYRVKKSKRNRIRVGSTCTFSAGECIYYLFA
jgi:hypothetical protein